MSRLHILVISFLSLALVAMGAVLLLREPPAPAPITAQAASLAEAPAGAPLGGQPALYRCPMHPDIAHNEPGDCPICGMKLVAVRDRSPELPRTETCPPVTEWFGSAGVFCRTSPCVRRRSGAAR